MADSSLNIVLFASGHGSNALNILDFSRSSSGRFTVQAVFCDRPFAPIVEKMRSWSVPLHVVAPPPKRDFPDPERRRLAHEQAVLDILHNYPVDWICLAGYMRLLSPHFLSQFYDKTRGVHRIVNIHPSLLPAFPGRDGYRAAWLYGAAFTGCTVHFVDAELDNGPVLLQSGFRIRPGEGSDGIRERGLRLEHKVYRRSLEVLRENAFRTTVREGRTVVLLTNNKGGGS